MLSRSAQRDRSGARARWVSGGALHGAAQSLHLIVEARDAVALARAIQALSIRAARAINRVLGRSGKVFADRYHAHALKTPTEVANAIAYVLGNSQVHAARKGRAIHPESVDALSSAANRNYVAEPRRGCCALGGCGDCHRGEHRRRAGKRAG